MCYGGVGQSVRVDPKADTSRGAVLDLQTREVCLGAVNSREGLRKGVVVRGATIGVSAIEGEMPEQHWARWSSDCGWPRREWGRWSLKKHRAWWAAVISQQRRVSRWTWVDDPRNYTVKQVLWFTVGLDGQALTQVSRRPGDDCTLKYSDWNPQQVWTVGETMRAVLRGGDHCTAEKHWHSPGPWHKTRTINTSVCIFSVIWFNVIFGLFWGEAFLCFYDSIHPSRLEFFLIGLSPSLAYITGEKSSLGKDL